MKSSFVFRWRIENFTMCLRKVGSFINSPTFNITTIDDNTKGYLRLYPYGKTHETQITVYLHIVNKYEKLPAESRIKLSFISSCRDSTEDKICDYIERNEKQSMYITKRRAKIYEERNSFLTDGIFTVECEIKGQECDSLHSVRCYGKTVVTVKCHSLEFPINIDIFTGIEGKNSLLKYLTTVLYKIQSEGSTEEFEVSFRSKCLVNGRTNTLFEVEKKSENVTPIAMTLKLSLACGAESIFLACGEQHFPVDLENSILQLPFTISEEKLECLRSNPASICCDFKISDGTTISSCEMDNLEDQNQNITSSSILKEILSKVYTDRIYSDVVLQADTDQYPANKCILASASPVFEVMFESNMEECKTNVINITDIDSSTIHKMLLFLYTGTVENYELDTTARLYSAADKYQVLKLKQKCSSYFLTNLSLENVCQILELAYLHSDQELLAGACRFIYSNQKRVFQSLGWKSLMDKHLKLAADVMFRILTKA